MGLCLTGWEVSRMESYEKMLATIVLVTALSLLGLLSIMAIVEISTAENRCSRVQVVSGQGSMWQCPAK